LPGPAHATALGSPGCGLDRAPGPSLRSRSRSASLLPPGDFSRCEPKIREDSIPFSSTSTVALARSDLASPPAIGSPHPLRRPW
jgi:hypothetical protein